MTRVKAGLSAVMEWTFVCALAALVGVTFAVVGVMYLRDCLRRVRA